MPALADCLRFDLEISNGLQRRLGPDVNVDLGGRQVAMHHTAGKSINSNHKVSASAKWHSEPNKLPQLLLPLAGIFSATPALRFGHSR